MSTDDTAMEDQEQSFQEPSDQAEETGNQTNDPPEKTDKSPPKRKHKNRNNGFRNRQYSDAYGSYTGGYGSPYFGPPGPPGPLRPPRPPGPMFVPPPPFFGPMMGPGPMRPRRPFKDDRVVKYLIGCGVPITSLKGLPRSLLDLLEPHNCGLCGYSFDTYHMSRIHYMSKNHQKKVTAWMKNAGTQGEGPLKAREIYCELCDVQITSKLHAESHCAGKPHRAVVEGRKNAKNPQLLQPGSERRLMQLIRREKRNLPAIAAADDDSKSGKDGPASRPDLYCDICKTSMTCSEQMTAHLNGKKHLSKEKNHILRTMRGETIKPQEEYPEDEGNGDGEAEDVTPEEENGETAKADGGEPENEEWSENWEN